MPGSASAIGRIKLVAGPAPATSATPPTVAAAAYGNSPQMDSGNGGTASGFSALHPFRSVGFKFWLGVGSVAFLYWVYRSLPE